MNTQKILIVSGIVILIAIGCLYAYLNALGASWALNKPDKRPFFVTTKQIVVKNILLPEGTKIIYKNQYFWKKHEQNKPLNPKDIIEISFMEGTTINWGGVPITSIVRFYNSEMKGFSVYADFEKLNKRTRFADLWESCHDNLGITVEDTEDWSFNKKNILNVESCGVNYQRYFEEDEDQQRFLDDLYKELMTINE
ncbi:MAG: hypothetical protein DWQ02_23380 [Bacteroidetes bacterium]|nr:MAG: hypothetical protein DWQ02_23380 [Bacteroidota bacterium]